MVFQASIGCLRTNVQKKENIGTPEVDLSGFVKTKKAGERILAMVHEVLGTTECKTFLDYRPSEPTWIQFKFQKEEFDLDMLDALSRKNNGVITKEIIESCKL